MKLFVQFLIDWFINSEKCDYQYTEKCYNSLYQKYGKSSARNLSHFFLRAQIHIVDYLLLKSINVIILAIHDCIHLVSFTGIYH